jgi:hypothetical protein
VKTERFHVPGALLVVVYNDRWNGLSYMAWKPHVSMHFRNRKDLLRFCSWPVKTPTGDRLRAWLDEVEGEAKKGQDTSVQRPDTSLSAEIQATGFGPECHLDETDPNYQTRTVI